MNLLIDIGNSNFKWCISNGVETGKINSFQYSFETIEALLTANLLSDKKLAGIENIYVCSVVEEKIKSLFSEWVSTNLFLTVIYVESSKKQFGVENAYDDVSSLGNDRWLSLIFAHNNFQSDVCVIDCGTAITIDVVLKNGQHQGGLIAPGFNSQIAGLGINTSIVKNQQYINQETSSLLQQNTHACIEQGSRRMSLGYIKDVVAQLKVEYGDTLDVVVTGGESSYLASDLPVDWHFCQDLIFQGLQFVSTEQQ